MAKRAHTPSEAPVVGQLARWKAQHAALGRLIESYEEAARIGAVLDPAEANVAAGILSAAGSSGMAAVGAAMELPVGAFLNMSIPEAIKLYLSTIKRKQTAREIAVALKEGGMESTAANWETTVTGALHRLKTAGEVLRFKDGWAFAGHYPDSLRARIAKDDKPKKRRGRQKKGARTATEKAGETDTTPLRRGIVLTGPVPTEKSEKAG